jgi:AcrR family transcriptional regulator
MHAGEAEKPSAHSRREQLLDLAADHVIAHGLDRSSLRELASALGVAHNNLTHHFGTRAELLAAIFERIAERQRTAGFSAAQQADPRVGVRNTWDSLSHPDLRLMWTAFFELYGAALRRPDEHALFLAHVVRDWIEPLAALATATGADPAVAAARATYVVATVRGLVLDRLAGGDETRIDAAVALLLDHIDDWT